MDIKLTDGQDAWIELNGYKELHLTTGSDFKVTDSGLLIITISDAKCLIYAPHTWKKISIVDKYALASNILLANTILDFPS